MGIFGSKKEICEHEGCKNIVPEGINVCESCINEQLMNVKVKEFISQFKTYK